ncbi:GNAT family N-acetyltransferase [Aestuariibaculum sediminum]|uniref:GNAT family N-acetyltransferase n=1 Tax=Aestuariibaculum sediminum TaxID=2770637 RepID=A0A8J6UBR6_9FLAO|nr:GNAT family N-acetyltransferase [Aestuariibaculum sediminum]MBD0831254.1 GNAT family N-acetyltransferase [Aestuariibaculum sediminum]
MYKIYSDVTHLPDSWNSFVSHDIFLQSQYLKALEHASPDNIKFYYIGVFKDNELAGVAIVQRVKLYLKDMFRTTQVSCAKDFFKNQVSKILKGNLLVVGNLMHTGQHGIYFDGALIRSDVFLNTVFEALEDLEKSIFTNENKKIRALVFKDYFLDDAINNEHQFFNLHNLHKVKVQPNMIMGVSKSWESFNDYLSSLNKKYRARYKRARKKRNGVLTKELDLHDINHLQDKLYSLYLNVSNNAKFNTFILPKNHFYQLKLQLNNRFKVFGYYLNDQLIGFYTLILNDKDLETYFLGYDAEHQYENQLYLNMLYDMAEFGINNRFLNIVYARTAMEIKSSVGAEAKPMVMYLKHTNGLLNAVLKQVFKLMNPNQQWEARHPFK